MEEIYQPKGYEKWAVAMAFAEGGMFEEAKRLVFSDSENRQKSQKGLKFGKLKGISQKVNKKRQELEDIQCKITFAESGALFDEPSSKAIQEQGELSYLLITTKSDRFSDYVMNYALDMAKRFGYRILALNIYPLPGPQANSNVKIPEGVIKEFETRCQENITNFKEKALLQGIHVEHRLMFERPDVAEQKVIKEFKDIKFVISDVAEELGIEDKRFGERPEERVFVCSIIT